MGYTDGDMLHQIVENELHNRGKGWGWVLMALLLNSLSADNKSVACFHSLLSVEKRSLTHTISLLSAEHKSKKYSQTQFTVCWQTKHMQPQFVVCWHEITHSLLFANKSHTYSPTQFIVCWQHVTHKQPEFIVFSQENTHTISLSVMLHPPSPPLHWNMLESHFHSSFSPYFLMQLK